ncbi:hypothetical protein JCM3774_001110 [Rhodotorula dairenensis]
MSITQATSSAAATARSRIAVYPVSPVAHPDALAFVKRLIDHGPSSPVAETSASTARTPGDSSGAAATLDSTYLPWTIRNKYYEADVHFCIHGEEALGRSGAEREVPAVIVLANAPRECSEAVAFRLASLAASEPCPDVCLLVTLCEPSSSDSSSATQTAPDGDEWEDLALAHGFEWVHIDASERHGDPERREAANEDGVAQVSAALHAHMWEGMRRSNPREALASSPGDGPREYEDVGQDSLLPPPAPRHREPPTLADEARATRAPTSRARPSSADLEPNHWSFPSTFLPSIPRNGDDGPAPAGPAGDSHECAFEDDFSPFMSGPTAFSSEQASRAGIAASDLAPTSASTPEFDGLADEEDLDALLARVSLARKEAEGMDLDARRRFAAQMVRDLLGDDTGLDEWSDEEA